jgi:hypothetical protein
MSGITNHDLEKLCKKFLGKNFLGVFPSDVLPRSNKTIQSIIFNLSKHNESGSHFIAIFKTSRKVFYFDSFGKDCSNENIKKFILNFKLKIENNTFQIQNNTSSLCGYYCFYFLHTCFLKRKSLNYFIKQFTTNKDKLFENELKLLKYILKIVKKYKTNYFSRRTLIKVGGCIPAKISGFN